ncbi:proline-rich protein 15-like protein [Pseudoliparis swirei]|uniref:proline-rich protein 15-like protein n=1 Tax=Pseudoliparis swirei TaxID=2059687 RepID=UPI0024BDCD23|nr:proline-rich protein 15-like protein [Pseudoliparis swirei]
MTERIPWWKAFLPKKKSGGSKETSSSITFDVDFDPFAERQKDQSGSDLSPSSQESSNSSRDDTYDDSRLESVFNEQTCRRNMKVSRSGRFKEKRRVRSTLPLQDKETETVASGREDMR